MKKTSKHETAKKAWYYLTLAAIFIIAISITVLRHKEAQSEDAMTSLALSVFLGALTLAPSLVCREVFAKLVPVEKLHRRSRLLTKKINGDKKKCEAAEKRIAQRAMHCAWWDEQRILLRAAYTLAFRENGGTVPTPVEQITTSVPEAQSLLPWPSIVNNPYKE